MKTRRRRTSLSYTHALHPVPHGTGLRAVFFFAALAAFPLIASAQSTSVRGVLERIGSAVQAIIPFLFAVAVTIFIVGTVRFVAASASEESRRSGRNLMLYGLIGLFIAVSVWGLAAILVNTFALPSEVTIPGAPEAPDVPEAERVINTVMNESVIPFLNILIAAATALFIWGVIEFMANADNEAARKKGAQHMVWGIVGLAIMASSRGILALLSSFISSF